MSGSNSSVPAGPQAAEPLSFTVHKVDTPLPAEAPPGRGGRRLSGRLTMFLVLLVCAAPVLVSYFTYFVIRPEGRSNYGQLILPMRTVPALELRTLDGAALAPRALHGQWLLVVVGPSVCATACQQQLFMQRQLREMLGRERDRVEKIWLIPDAGPVDPVLRRATEAGVAVQVLRVDRAALAAWLEPEPGRALEDHLYIVDPMGQWMMRMPVEPKPGRVKRDLERLLRASASWDTAGR